MNCFLIMRSGLSCLSPHFSKNFTRLVFSAFCLFLLLISAQYTTAQAGAKPDITQLTPQKIDLKTRRVSFRRGAKEQKIFGSLIFKNGYSLSSSSPFWGGLSGMAISKKGNKLALVSDAGFWAILDLNYKDQLLIAPREALVGPLLSKSGKVLTRSKDRDAEAITLLKSDKFFGKALISFEDNHRIGRFSIGKNGINSPARYLKLPSITRRLSGNAGLEAMAVLRGGKYKGALVAITQSKKDRNGNFIGWIVRKGKIRKIRFTPPPLDKYRITDAVSLANGDLLLLERRYKFLTVNIRVRYVKHTELLSNRPIRGRIVLEANNHEHVIDNMEGITAHINKKGETIITLLSDDNFNGFQQTLLMQFALPRNWKMAWK